MGEKDERQRQIDAAWAAHWSIQQGGRLRDGWLDLHLRRQNRLCFYCAVRFDDDEIDPLMRPTLDHVVPLSKGGADSLENTVAACALCNSAKSDMMPDEVSTLLPAARVRILCNRDKKFDWRPDKRHRG